jgi:hypothetical protein
VIRLLIAFALVGTVSIAGVMYKNGEVEKVLEKELSKNSETIKYRELHCVGVVETNCKIFDLKIVEGNSTLGKVNKVTIENVEDGLAFSIDKNGTLPFSVKLEGIELSDSLHKVEELNFMEKNLSLYLSGNFFVKGDMKTLHLEKLLLDSELFQNRFSLDIQGSSKTNLAVKNLSISYRDRGLLDQMIDEIAKESGKKERAVKQELLSNISELDALGLEEYSEALSKVVSEDNISSISISAETKDGQYISIQQLYMGYMIANIGGQEDALIKYLNTIFKVEVEVK